MTKPEAVYRLTPLQEGMLFHTLHSPDSDQYVEQLQWRYRGELDLHCLKKAWQSVIEASEAMRSFFTWEKVSQPMQVVVAQVELPWCYQDWRIRDKSIQCEMWHDWLATDRKQGFSLTKPGVQRFLVAHLKDDEWAFCWSCHHIILDGWSASLVFIDLARAYRSHLAGNAVFNLSRPKLGRYSAWINKQDREQARTFWRDHLDGFSSASHFLNTKSDYIPDSSRPIKKLARYHFGLGAPLTRELVHFVRLHNVTLNCLVQLVWAHLNVCYSGQARATHGTTLSGRGYPIYGIEELVGMFLATVPLSMEWNANEPLVTALKNLQNHLLGAQEFGYLPLPEMQELACSKGSLFSSLVVFENYPEIDSEKIDVLYRHDVKHDDKTNYPLTLLAHPGSQLHFTLTYDEDGYEGQSIKRLGDFMCHIFTRIPTSPSLTLGSLKELPPEQKQALVALQGSEQIFNDQNSLLDILDEQARRSPTNDALIAGNTHLNYKQLHQRARNLAAAILRTGCHRLINETPVAIYAEPGAQMVICLLAVIKAGASYLPLDPEFPDDRNAFILKESGACLVIYEQRFRNRITRFAHCLCLCSDDESEIDAQLPTNVLPGPSDVAYIIYTSGSTGKPKGVMIENRALLNRLDWMQRTYALGENDKVLQKTPYTFDVSVWEFFWPLSQGATLVVTEPGGHKDPDYLYRIIQDESITHLHFVPSMAQAFCTVVGHKSPLTTVKHLYCSGEALQTTVTKKLKHIFTNAKIFNLYGPTEAAIDVSAFSCGLDDDSYGSVTPIGKPIQNTGLLILDAFHQPVPFGVPGEVYITGTGLARDYINRPDLTEERFVEIAWQQTTIRAYKSGDLARWLADGNLAILGRTDNQIKLRGFRIELAEIETELEALESIRQAAVTIDKEHDQLIAYIVPSISGNDDVINPRSDLAAVLPHYMVPQQYRILPQLPLTPSGKLDRKRLSAVKPIERQSQQLALSTVEKQLLPVWEKVLGIQGIGPENNFFSLGGHSLSALSLISQINAQPGPKLSVKDLFENPTLGLLGNHLTRLGSQLSKEENAIPLDYSQPQPLSSTQAHFWVGHKVGTPALYNIPCVLKLRGKLDIDCLQYALNQLVQRHASLRTIFFQSNSTPVQLVTPEADLPIVHIRVDEADLCCQLERLALTPFRLDKAPLVRATLLEPNDNKFLLCLTLHHLIADGWSINLLLTELFELYERKLFGRSAPLSPIEWQYVDYVASQASLPSTEKELQRTWWKKQDYDIPLLCLPTDTPRPSTLSHRGNRIPLQVPKALTGQLDTMARDHKTTLFSVLLCSWYSLLHIYTGQEKLCVGTSLAMRADNRFDNTVGVFVNVLPLSIKLDREKPFTQLLNRVGTLVREAISNQDIPFDEILEISGAERELNRTPLFQTMFVLQSYRRTSLLKAKDLQIEPGPLIFPIAKFEITIDLSQTVEGLVGDLEFSTDLFDKLSMEHLRDRFLILLKSIAENPKTQIEALDISTPRDRLLLAQLNQTQVPTPETNLVQQFVSIAEDFPQRAALTFGNQTLSYAQLAVRVENLSLWIHDRYRHQHGLDMPPETIIAISANRGIPWITTLLAVLKAGGAYLPINPDTPATRIAFILTDAAAAMLLYNGNGPPESGYPCPVLPIPKIDDLPSIHREPSQPIKPNHLAYVIYTSGSNGTPKGVMVEHRNCLNYLNFLKSYLKIKHPSNIDCSSNIAFDFTFTTSVAALALGHHVHICDDEIRLNIPRYFQYLYDHQIVTAKLSPKLFSLLTHYAHENPLPLALNHIILGGEAVVYQDVAIWLDRYPGTTIHDEYGPTEATVGCCHFPLSSKNQLPTGNGSIIGKPGPNIEVYILDPRLKPCAPGIPGELFIGGYSLARGYLNRQDLTDERFITWRDENAGIRHLYASGDRARLLTTGEIEFLGRLDDQVKINGYRIELAEIEHTLLDLPQVKQAIVLHQQNKDHLVAYVVTHDPSDQVETIKQTLTEYLPHYMIPNRIMQLEQFPLTYNGKVNRNALPLPIDREQIERTTVEASSSEAKLERIWSHVLGCQDIGINDNFFDLGGDSVSMIKTLPMILKAFNLNPDQLSILSLFTYPNIESLAKFLDGNRDHPIATTRPKRHSRSEFYRRTRRRSK